MRRTPSGIALPFKKGTICVNEYPESTINAQSGTEAAADPG